MVLVFWPKPVHAYLDPGTGSMLVQGLIAVVAAAAVTVRVYWQRIQAAFGRAPEAHSDGDGSQRD
jgi:hypothetical protein